jgi:peptidoglycan/xylan/chitin deacetylase (PgdA/CDA1 family)
MHILSSLSGSGRFQDFQRRIRSVGLRIGIVSALLLAILPINPTPASAAASTQVSLTFDGGLVAQYNLAYQQALAPHGAHATFFVNSGTIGASGKMTWAQLSTLRSAGDDIGGKTVHGTNLKTTTDMQTKINEVCNDRQSLIQHGLAPVAFAYPGGAFDATAESIVKNCGYGNGRSAGSVSPGGTVYAETLPPKDWFATRAYAPSTQVTLANMEALVNGAATHNGGWDQIVIGKVCSQALDPNNYSTCTTSAGWIELGDLNSFLDWMQASGQTGGAPTGASLQSVRDVVLPVDTGAPTSAISCNGAACATTQYVNPVSVSLTATDVGSGLDSTHYTTDGKDPTQASPTYSGAFTVSSATTVKFRSWDIAGNVEATQTQTIDVAPGSQDTTPPTTTITCNGSACAPSYNLTVNVALNAADAGGAGVDKTYYTTDGSTPTTSSPVYTGPFQLSQSAMVQFFSTDLAGNAEQVQSQAIHVSPPATTVSLTFDNGSISQYALGYQQALQPHTAHATFFVNSGTVGSSNKFMSWSQLTGLQADGNDIGGKTVHNVNLVTATDNQTKIDEVCNDRQALLSHALNAIDFAYPSGAVDATAKGIVKNCGYGNGRTAGSLSPSGSVYAETLPPKDWFATRTWAPAGQVTLANMQALITGASSHGGGWDQIVINKVCSQSLDSANYSTCATGAGWIELADLNSFLDWVQNAGQSGGAPEGTVLKTAAQALMSADTTPPSTSASCDGSPCATSTYSNTVQVSLSPTDIGSSVSSTHYTTDGSDPTLSSPTYTKAIPVTTTTDLKFRSWDYAGNAEAVQTQHIDVSAATDTTPPTTTIACNASACGSSGYDGAVTVSLSATDVGLGVDKTYYTTDGSTPDTTSTVYSAPFQLNQAGTYAVKFFSTDLAGNQEQVQSQTIQVLAPPVTVSLTFDDGLESQYALAYKHALQPHGVNGTFFIITGNTGTDDQAMTWDQLTNLNNGGNEIGGHTVHHINMKTTTDMQTKIDEVCNNRQDLLQHGFFPVSFAYPFGAYDATAESIVQNCGFKNARAAGGIDTAGDGAGPVYAETLPPKDMYAIRSVYDPNGQLTLSHLEASVTAAAQHGGGWVPFGLHEFCSQTLDPANYSFCSTDFGSMELTTFNQFLDWLQTSGQPGGAPARVSVKTVSQVLDGPDTQKPTTVVQCDGTPCDSTKTYRGSVTVSLRATDPGGSGIKQTYYTTDGSTPTMSSPTYSGQPFTIGSPETIKAFSVDNDGNVEAVQSQTIDVQPNPDPIIGAAGDIACDPSSPAFNGGLGTGTDCVAADTAGLLGGVDAVLPIGDDQYDCGGLAAFNQAYDPTWGVKKAITYPVPGDKDYATTGGTDCPSTPGAGYYSYFGARAGDPSKGYYSYNLGAWHVVALNTAPCPDDPTTCAAGSAQDTWLKADLATNPSQCTLAYFQNPRWVSSGSGGDATYQPIWQDLYNGGVDVVMNGDTHWYERFQPMNASGKADSTYGVREFVVGTGGAGLDDTPPTRLTTSQVLNQVTHGVMRMTLHNGSFDWQFVHANDGTFTDSGTANCHGAPPTGPDTVAPTTTITCNSSPCASTVYSAPVSVALSATDNLGGSGVASTHYTTDGTAPSLTSPEYTQPFSVTKNTTVKFRSWDNAGNAEATNSQTINFSLPTTTIACNTATCSSGWYKASVSVTMSATDVGGPGIASTHYTLNGTDPTLSSPSYTGAFSIAVTKTVKYRSWDTAGNVEPTNTQLIQIDTAKPTTAIGCNGTTCSTGWYRSVPVAVTLTATDTGGSGVDKTYYSTDGNTPTTSSTVYAGAFNIKQTTTVKYFTVDKAGNVGATGSVLIKVDAAAPTVSITKPTNGSTLTTAATTVTASASDLGTGTGNASGLLQVEFFRDSGVSLGVDTTASPWSVTWTPTVGTHTLYAIATDKAGNTTKSATITVTVK